MTVSTGRIRARYFKVVEGTFDLQSRFVVARLFGFVVVIYIFKLPNATPTRSHIFPVQQRSTRRTLSPSSVDRE